MSIPIGTRGSALALRQTQWVVEQLRARAPGIEFELHVIKTRGDRIQDVALAQVGGKGLFVKEIETALLAGEVDLAVHSMKDLPTEIPDGLCLAAVPRREDPSDALISASGVPLDRLPLGARIGTSSLRRQAQIKHYRSDLEVSNLRGNLDTRLRKVNEGQFDATVLAAAGLVRMGWEHQIAERLSHDICLPAVGQGALAIEVRADDASTRKLVALLDDAETGTCVTAERSLLRALQGGCQVPIGALAVLNKEGTLSLDAMIASPDGRELIRDALTAAARDAEQLGRELADRLLDQGGRRILEQMMRWQAL